MRRASLLEHGAWPVKALWQSVRNLGSLAARRPPWRACGKALKPLGLSAILGLAAAGAAAGLPEPPRQLMPPGAIPEEQRQSIAEIANRYSAAQDEGEKTQAAQALAEQLWTAPFLPQRRQGGVGLPDALIQAMARDMAGNVPQARMNAVARILAVADTSGRAAMAGPLLAHLRQAQAEPDRASTRTALWTATRGAPETIFQAIRDTRDERTLGDLAQIAAGLDLPDDVRLKLDAASATSTSPTVRIQIAQTLGPGSTGYRDIVRELILALERAPSDEARDRLIATLGGFPKPDDAIAQAMIDAVSRANTSSRVTWRTLAQSGPAGLLYLAGSIKGEADATRLVDKATMMAAVVAESWPLPAEIASAVIEAAIDARLRSDDPLLRSSVQAMLLRAGQAAVAPLRQTLDHAAPGQARDDLAAALVRLQGR